MSHILILCPASCDVVAKLRCLNLETVVAWLLVAVLMATHCQHTRLLHAGPAVVTAWQLNSSATRFESTTAEARKKRLIWPCIKLEKFGVFRYFPFLFRVSCHSTLEGFKPWTVHATFTCMEMLALQETRMSMHRHFLAQLRLSQHILPHGLWSVLRPYCLWNLSVRSLDLIRTFTNSLP